MEEDDESVDARSGVDSDSDDSTYYEEAVEEEAADGEDAGFNGGTDHRSVGGEAKVGGNDEGRGDLGEETPGVVQTVEAGSEAGR